MSASTLYHVVRHFHLKRSTSLQRRNHRLAQSYLLLVACCLACTHQDATGTYLASVPFCGSDPRFIGQHYQWLLKLNQDGSYSFSFELPLAVYTEAGQELIGKGSGETKGRWKQSGSKVVLIRDSGEASLGSLNTLSFSMEENRLIIQVRDGKAILIQGGNRLVLVKKIGNR